MHENKEIAVHKAENGYCLRIGENFDNKRTYVFPLFDKLLAHLRLMFGEQEPAAPIILGTFPMVPLDRFQFLQRHYDRVTEERDRLHARVKQLESEKLEAGRARSEQARNAANMRHKKPAPRKR